MALFNLFSKRSDGPYNDPALNKIYQMLFCDDITVYRQPELSGTGYPWSDLLTGTPDANALRTIASDKTLESRQRLLAYRLLAFINEPAADHELLGVVIEVGLESGLDVLAAFKDGTARYLNHSEKLLVWETSTPESEAWINQLYADSSNVVKHIGAWNEKRKPFPTKGMVRLSFLLSDGLYFGEGPFDVLQKDAMGGPVIESATGLMMYLTQHAIGQP